MGSTVIPIEGCRAGGRGDEENLIRKGISGVQQGYRGLDHDLNWARHASMDDSDFQYGDAMGG